MSETRDPRKDPRPGDRLHVPSINFTREVTGVRDGVVSYDAGRLGYEMDLAKWQHVNSRAEVLRRGE